jgi:hypothetical protein
MDRASPKRIAHRKRKERIALAIRIERSNRDAQTCSHCRAQGRRCLLDKSESLRCSECVRATIPCDTTGYKRPVVPRKVVCRFFLGSRRPQPKPVPSPAPVSSWFPAFELDALLDFNLDDPLWADLEFSGVATRLGAVSPSGGTAPGDLGS